MTTRKSIHLLAIVFLLFQLAAFSLPAQVAVAAPDSTYEVDTFVESNDARILSMHISSNPDSTSREITLKVNTTDLTSIIKTFERYSYEVTTWVTDDDELDRFYTDRYNMLMKYLNM